MIKNVYHIPQESEYYESYFLIGENANYSINLYPSEFTLRKHEMEFDIVEIYGDVPYIEVISNWDWWQGEKIRHYELENKKQRPIRLEISRQLHFASLYYIDTSPDELLYIQVKDKVKSYGVEMRYASNHYGYIAQQLYNVVMRGEIKQ